MKKLMIAAAIVCAAALSQAATANWNIKPSSSTQVFWTDTAGKNPYSGTGYLFVLTGIFTQDTLLSNWRKDGASAITGYAKDFTIDSDGKLVKTSFSNTATSVDEKGDPNGTQKFFVAVLNGDELFLTDTVTVNETGLAGGNDIAVKSSVASKKFWEATDTFGGTGGKGAGWYAAAAVPEPTSGLLLLLGVAGLALRRRRA